MIELYHTEFADGPQYHLTSADVDIDDIAETINKMKMDF